MVQKIVITIISICGNCLCKGLFTLGVFSPLFCPQKIMQQFTDTLACRPILSFIDIITIDNNAAFLNNGLKNDFLRYLRFVFIMGTSIAIALRSQLRRGMSRKQLSFKVLKRTVILFFLGLVVSNGNGNGLYKFQLSYFLC